MKAFLLGLVVVVVLGVGGYAVFHKSPAKTSPTSTANQTTSSSTQSTPDTITYSDKGFSPTQLTVKAGTTVTIKNTASDAVAMDSNPHPVHTDDTDLNIGEVAPGQSKTFTVNKTGSYGYHNHLNPSEQGKIIIE